MAKQPENNNEKFKSYINTYLSQPPSDELEVRFGTKKKITQIKFDSVVAKLRSLGFTCQDLQGNYHMNIQNEYTDERTGKTKTSNLRTEIRGLDGIKEYCKKNTFNLANPEPYIVFVQKQRKYINDTMLTPIDFDNFGFRVNYKTEYVRRFSSRVVQSTLHGWMETKKIFRVIKRFTFTHQEYPLKIDCSIVRSSKSRGRRMIPEYRIESSEVFENPETFEIEVELESSDSTKMYNDFLRKEKMTVDKVLFKIKKVIKIILSGLQDSNFPISYSEEKSVLSNYMNLIFRGKKSEERPSSKYFVGFSSISLEVENISEINNDSTIANIRQPYTVTEKADGIRKLLYINKDGKVYFIDVNMNVQFTGMISNNRDYHESLIDGEHVLHDKYGAFINHYMAFDAYYVGKEDIRPLTLATHATKNNAEDASETKQKINQNTSRTRLIELHNIVKHANFQSIIGKKDILTIREKTFYLSQSADIFKNCNKILSNVDDGLFEYETDGLIFTPSDKGVGSDTIGEKLPPTKITWRRSFKWKPPEFNTVDFLVTTKKTDSGTDFVGNIFEDGTNMHDATQLTQYKTLVLRVGFSERMHGYLNPCEDVIQGDLPSKSNKDERERYKPVPFYPSDPTPEFPAYLCNIILEESNGINHMLTENGKETFTDGTIVEFRYDIARNKGYQWIPIRVRNDKTSQYRLGRNNFGNAYHVANSVWRSIHNPVTASMIRTGKNIPSELVEEDVYYNRKSNSTITRALRDFHNLFVKRALILGVSNRGDSLIDMTVGKGGDFPKWIAAKLSFIFGLDVSRDNIENRMNGVCARYLNYRKKWRAMPSALFVNANSGLNIRNGDACFTDKGKQITKAVFGEGVKDKDILGEGVFKHYGKGTEGFQVVSNQFAIHYFFENKEILNSFLRNVSECCKVGGYFIGTSYDGRKVFRALEGKKPGEGIRIMVGEEKMWEITKQYDSDVFVDNESCLGYQVDVYQESINKVFPEYLVNYDYMAKLMEQYGFALLSNEESKELGFPASIGNFNILFNEMKERINSKRLRRSDVGSAINMTPDEKKVSFLNKFFIFKKIRDVNAEEVERVQLNISIDQIEGAQKTSEVLSNIVESVAQDKPKVKKLGKIKLKAATSITKTKRKLKIPKLKIPKLKIKGPVKN